MRVKQISLDYARRVGPFEADCIMASAVKCGQTNSELEGYYYIFGRVTVAMETVMRLLAIPGIIDLSDE